MHNLKILFKNNYNLLIGKLSGKKQRKSTLVATILLALGILAILAIYSFQAYSMFNGLSKIQLEKVCIFHSILTSLSVIVIIGIMRSSANQKGNDTEFLLSLPLKKSEIIFSKTLNIYIFDWFFAFLLFMPYLIIYQIMVSFNLSLLLLGILYIFLLPLLSIGISYICDFVISRLFNRIKLGNLLKTFTILAVFVTVMGLMLIKTFTYGTADYTNLNLYFSNRPISNYILNFLFTPNAINTIIIILSAVLPFTLGLILYVCNYGKTFQSYTSNNRNLKFGNGKNPIKMLYKKELYSYASCPAYLINTIIGAIMIIAISIFACSIGFDGIIKYLNMNISKSFIACAFVTIFCFMISTAPISASSISLEGKNIWLLKSTPINEKNLFLSKALVHISILEPCIILSSLMLTIFLNFNILQFLTIFIVPSIFILITAFGGILINLWQPVLEFDNETKVVKQSLSVLITMILSILLSLLPYGVLKLFSTLSLGTIIIISSSIYLLLLLVILLLLFTLGVKLFRKL